MSTTPSIISLINVLKAQPANKEPRSWQELEDHVKNVYQTILDLENKTILVARDVQITGRHGGSYQIDVYYEFELAGLRHRVAIECKNTQRPVDRDRVIAFKGKMDDCVDVKGVMVAANGYQSGAIDFAEKNGVVLIEVSDLPSIGNLLAMRLEHAAVPTESSIGQPFWAIYDIETASPHGRSENGRVFGLLFWSQRQAAIYLARQGLSKKWAVRGLTRWNLKTFIMMVDAFDGRFAISPPPNHELAGDHLMFSEIKRKTLIDDFCDSKNTPPEKPMVMPHLREKPVT